MVNQQALLRHFQWGMLASAYTISNQAFSVYTVCSNSNNLQCFLTTDGTPFVKGGTLEALVEVLTNLPRCLWGGIQLMSPGPKWNSNVNISLSKLRSKVMKVEPTEEKIFEFFLTTCRSFCEPIILFRLLVHRLVSLASSVSVNG